jgi:hypothetical protein
MILWHFEALFWVGWWGFKKLSMAAVSFPFTCWIICNDWIETQTMIFWKLDWKHHFDLIFPTQMFVNAFVWKLNVAMVNVSIKHHSTCFKTSKVPESSQYFLNRKLLLKYCFSSHVTRLIKQTGKRHIKMTKKIRIVWEIYLRFPPSQWKNCL